ncbi:MAG: hypothetical protein HDR05_12645 [Lachnospiraceae bacterium]|nr:hypothetical protein [Lachnospiraceae bacterium]
MKKLVFNDGRVDIKENRGSHGEGSVINIREDVLEQACRLGLLSKTKETEKNVYYSDNFNNITLISCKKTGLYMQVCIVDSYIGETPITKVLENKAICLHEKSRTRKDFRVSVKSNNKSGYNPINLSKLLKYYESGKIESLEEIIDIRSGELHHRGILADNRLTSTILFDNAEDHQNYHQKHGKQRHYIECNIENTDNLVVFLDFLNSPQYNNCIESFVTR